MDQNLQNNPTPLDNQPQVPPVPTMVTQTVVEPVQPVPSQTQQTYSVSQSEHHTGKSFVKILLLLIIIVGITAGLVYGGWMLMGGENKIATNPKNANVFVGPTKTVSPTPSVYQINPSDTSDGAIDKDTQIVSDNLNTLDTNISDVDKSLKDQQTNLN
jgi:hypothetical protein